jgi:hypothetical protein
MRIWIISPRTFYGLVPVWIVASGSHTKVLVLTSCMGWRLVWSPLSHPHQKFGRWLTHYIHTLAKSRWAIRLPIFWHAPELAWRAWASTKQPLRVWGAFFVFTLLLANIVKWRCLVPEVGLTIEGSPGRAQACLIAFCCFSLTSWWMNV